MTLFVTVGRASSAGWDCVDDAGRRRFLPREALDPQVVNLRVGQRLRVWTTNGTITRAAVV
ncbi:MAG: hypothetical protein ACK5LS_13765 [Propioniciclava sp.]